jgi:hypothetical protein
VLGLRAANATRCREGLALELRKPALADPWSQGDDEGCSCGACGDEMGMRGRRRGRIMQESGGRWGWCRCCGRGRWWAGGSVVLVTLDHFRQA